LALPAAGRPDHGRGRPGRGRLVQGGHEGPPALQVQGGLLHAVPGGKARQEIVSCHRLCASSSNFLLRHGGERRRKRIQGRNQLWLIRTEAVPGISWWKRTGSATRWRTSPRSKG